MKTLKGLVIILAVLTCTILFAGAQNKTAHKPPVIKHEPVLTAVREQPISVRAVVTSSSAELKSVSLCFTTSKDAAPSKIAMQDSGAGTYFGSIPSTFLKGVKEVAYYIEALDDQAVASETRWYTVKLQAPQSAGSSSQPTVSPTNQPPSSEGGSSWKVPAIIAGGTIAVVGGAIALASDGSNSSSTNTTTGSTTTNSTSGTYTGTATKYLLMSGAASPTGSSYAVIISISSAGVVTTDTLEPGSHMQGQLSGSDFQLTAQISATNLTGQIAFFGSVANSRITGTISGSVAATSGTNGIYSGIFSASK